MNISVILLVFLIQQSDWSQWGGEQRAFQVDLSLASIDPNKPLDECWQIPVGSGYSGLTTKDGFVVSQDRQGDDEFIFALDSGSGKEVWRSKYAAPALEFMIPRYGFGPHSTPCIAECVVCSVGGTGIVRGTDLKTGATKWSHSIWNEYEGTRLERGYSASPVFFDGKFILPVGGQGTGFVAFDATTGNEVWRATDFEAAYASPIIATLAGKPQLVCLMVSELVALDPANGKLLWSYKYTPLNTVHVASPIKLPGNRIFFLSSNLATLIEVGHNEKTFTVEKLWESRQMTFQVGNSIMLGNQILGPSSTSSTAILTAIKQSNGERLWRNRISGVGFLYKTNDGFIAIDESGKITFNQMQGGELITIPTHRGSLQGRIWNTAAFVGDRMYVRDEAKLHAFRLRRK